MKILFLNHNYIGYGTYWRCLNLGKYLARRGHQVTLLTTSSKDFDLTIQKKTLEKGMELIILPRIKISQYHTGHTLRAFLNIFFILTKSYDLVHAFVFPVHPIALPALVTKIIKKKPLVIDSDDLWKNGWANYHFWLIKKQLEFCEDKLPFLADKITVVSPLLQQRFWQLGIPKQKIIKLVNGADIINIKPLSREKSRKEMKLPLKTPLLLVMGHTFTESLFIFLKAFEKVVQTNPKVKIIFLGKMSLSSLDNNRLASLCKSIGKEHFIFTKEIPFKKVPLYLASADVLILPMDNNNIETARFPMRLGDYLASGRPIISNAVGEVKNILLKYKCGLISPPQDYSQLAKNIILILQNKKLGKNLGQQARKTAENVLAWPLLAKKLEKIYFEVLKK